jgi:hypothetical protein
LYSTTDAACHLQLAYSTVKGVQGASVVGISIDAGDKTGKGSLEQCTSLQSSDAAWEPMAHDRQQWMEFDLLEQQDVAGIQTVGSVQSMKVLFRSSLQDEWSDYFLSESKPFTGSSVTFEVPVLARYVFPCASTATRPMITLHLQIRPHLPYGMGTADSNARRRACDASIIHSPFPVPRAAALVTCIFPHWAHVVHPSKFSKARRKRHVAAVRVPLQRQRPQTMDPSSRLP